MDKKQAAMRSYFHTYWMKTIKKELGGKCTYISHLKKGSGEDIKNFIKINIKNSNGGRDKILFEIKQPLETLRDTDYIELLDILKSGEYEKSGETL